MLNEVYYNNTLQDWLISAAIIVFALFINGIITLLNRRYLKKLAQRTRVVIDNILVNTLETPLKVGIILLTIWTAFSRLEMSEQFDSTLYKVYEILAVLNVTWFIVNLLSGLIDEYFAKKSKETAASKHKHHVDSHLISIIRKTIMFLVWTIGIITALSNVGLDVKAILGTLGIGGVALALAAQDTVKNIFGGFTILVDGTFRIGDNIVIGAHEGTIEDIGIRSTRIRNYDKRLVTIPNYKIVEDAVVNISAAPQHRIITNLGIVYSTSPELMKKALEILLDIAKEQEAVSQEGASAVFENFGDSSLNIRYCYFVKKSFDKLQTVSSVNLEILKRFDEAGIGFAFPTQTLIVEKG